MGRCASVERYDVIIPQRRRLSEFGHVGADRQVRAIDPAQLVRIGMDVNQRLAGVFGRDQGVAVGRRLTQPRADGDHQIGLLDPIDQFGVRAIAQVSGPDRAGIRDRVLAAEGARHRQPDPLGKAGELFAGLGMPASSADNRHWRCGSRQQVHQHPHRIRADCLGGAVDRGARGMAGDFFEQHIFRQRDHDRAGPSGQRD